MLEYSINVLLFMELLFDGGYFIFSLLINR